MKNKKVIGIVCAAFSIAVLGGLSTLNGISSKASDSNMADYKITYETNSADKVTLHYGLNGWNNVKDAEMIVAKKGENTTTYKAIVSVEKGTKIDYCFKLEKSNSENNTVVNWDNNGGKNFCVTVNDSNATIGSRTISYEVDGYTESRFMKSITLHYGFNGWNNTKDVVMEKNYQYSETGILVTAVYSATITGEKGDTIDYAFKMFKTGIGETWNNNNGSDYHVVIE